MTLAQSSVRIVADATQGHPSLLPNHTIEALEIKIDSGVLPLLPLGLLEVEQDAFFLRG